MGLLLQYPFLHPFCHTHIVDPESHLQVSALLLNKQLLIELLDEVNLAVLYQIEGEVLHAGDNIHGLD